MRYLVLNPKHPEYKITVEELGKDYKFTIYEEDEKEYRTNNCRYFCDKEMLKNGTSRFMFPTEQLEFEF